MAERDAEIAGFLAGHGWAGATRRPLKGDASFRRYERVFAGDCRAVLMDAPPAHEDVRPFVAVARHLTGRGFSAPAILASDEEAGLLLLEDLGDDLFTRLLAQGSDEMSLYEAAVDLLVALHRVSPDALDVPPYDDARLHAEADLLVNWFVPAVSGAPAPAPVRAAYTDAWDAVFPLARSGPKTLVLRDYHADNLLWLPGRDGVRRVGLLDFQDAVVGPAAYDLVSLLEDARRDVAEATVAAMIARYLAGRREIDRDAFAAAYAVLGAQRNAKIVGIFTRLWKRDGKPLYLDYLPRVWGHLERDLAHPALSPVRGWFDAHVPPAWRGRPAGLGP
ncbi:MAG: aminoglycoside phosphotransferase family protein [Alphaproteobacteria bacterium]